MPRRLWCSTAVATEAAEAAAAAAGGGEGGGPGDGCIETADRQRMCPTSAPSFRLGFPDGKCGYLLSRKKRRVGRCRGDDSGNRLDMTLDLCSRDLYKQVGIPGPGYKGG